LCLKVYSDLTGSITGGWGRSLAGVEILLKGELMANDTPLPSNELLAFATLLEEALRIEDDLTRRLSQHPKQKSLLKLQKEYQQLRRRLAYELERALTSYLK
jgi:hypothetical protein